VRDAGEGRAVLEPERIAASFAEISARFCAMRASFCEENKNDRYSRPRRKQLDVHYQYYLAH
jgi:hypothetical protein